MTVAIRKCLSPAVTYSRKAPVAEVEESSTSATCNVRHHTNVVQFLLRGHAHTEVELLVILHRDVSKNKKIVNRVSLSQLLSYVSQVACRVAKGCIVNRPLS